VYWFWNGESFLSLSLFLRPFPLLLSTFFPFHLLQKPDPLILPSDADGKEADEQGMAAVFVNEQ